MKKCALIIDCNNKKSFIGKMKETMFSFLGLKKKDLIEADDIEFFLVSIMRRKTHRKQIEEFERVLRWIVHEKIDMVGIDDYFVDNFNDIIIKHTSLNIATGHTLFLSLIIPMTKRLLKSKGINSNEVSCAVISSSDCEKDGLFIKHLSTEVKYLTYIFNDSKGANQIIDSMLDDIGLSIQVCDNINVGIDDIGLLINLDTKNIDIKTLARDERLLVVDWKHKDDINNRNISIVNSLDIDISSKITIRTELKSNQKLILGEMYILSRIGENSISPQSANLLEYEDMNDFIKKCGFKVSKLEGINL